MDVFLDVTAKQIRGHEIITWQNISNEDIHELQFHLYMNAFKNTQSSYFKENNGRTGIIGKKRAWGWIDIDTLRIDSSDLTHQIEFIHPDDDNENDQTVIRILLPETIGPGEQIQIQIHFTTQLPRVFERNGYYKDYFFVAQWFPKIGVYIDNAWNCHQYHGSSEFFADYGVYDVNITLPKEYIVGATGQLQNTSESEDMQTHTFRAEDVHDFAWTAWPEYMTHRDTHRGIEINLLYDEDHSATVSRYLESLKNALDFFSEWIGEYPYPNVTIVDPPTGCITVGGMEYPTLFTVGTFWRFPRGIRAPELVTIHEFGHEFWYGIVGNNEFEEAWLDEGINSYTEARIMNQYYGTETSVIDFMGIRIGELAYHRGAYIPSPSRDRILREAWTYIGGGYGMCSYNKAALMLWTLENLVGRETMDQIMKTFFQRWKFKHPKSQDFIDIVNEMAETNYDWFFQQVLYGSNELDYRVASVRTEKIKGPKGVLGRKGRTSSITGKGSKQNTDLYHSIVKVNRKGEVVIPVEVRMVFANADTVLQTWDGQDRWIKYEFIKPAKLVSAEVDPERKLVLDTSFANNSRTIQSHKGPITSICVKLLYWFESALHIFSFFS